MQFLILGRGKTGALVADSARNRGHEIRAVTSAENIGASALTPDKLNGVDVVIDFTTPASVVGHIEACVSAGKNMVVGTTGWHGERDRIRKLVESKDTGLVYSPNFSVGVNIFLEMARAAASALHHDYRGQIFERHYAQKKDAPSGTAMALQGLIREASGQTEDLEIISFREGDVVGMHEIVLESSADRIYLCHDAKSRHGYAEGAVRAAEWIAGKKGFYEFKDIWRDL